MSTLKNDRKRAAEMDKPETLKEFYQRKFTWLPEDVRNDLGHFNVFKLEPLQEGQVATIPYRRRDFYKIILVKGSSCVHYADKTVAVKKQALSFSNPLIPYKWEHLDKIHEGVYCIFNNEFVIQFATINQYEVSTYWQSYFRISRRPVHGGGKHLRKDSTRI